MRENKSDFKGNRKCSPNDSVGCVLQKQTLETPALANDAETMQSQEKRLRPVVWTVWGLLQRAKMCGKFDVFASKKARMAMAKRRIVMPAHLGASLRCRKGRCWFLPSYRGKTRDGSWRKRLRYAAISVATVLKSFTLSRRISLMISFRPAR